MRDTEQEGELFYSSLLYRSACAVLVTVVSECSSAAQQLNRCLFLQAVGGGCGVFCFGFLFRFFLWDCWVMQHFVPDREHRGGC